MADRPASGGTGGRSGGTGGSRDSGRAQRAVQLWIPLGLAVLGLLLGTWSLGGPYLRSRLAGHHDGEMRDSMQSALARGNQLVRRSEPEAAVEAYQEGWPGLAAAGGEAGPAAALAYNLGTTYHRLGRLPEALLWYRRAALLAPADPWLEDNLELVRAELAAPRFPAPGVTGHLAAHPALAPAVAVALSWLALALWLLRPHLEQRARRPSGEAVARHAWAVLAVCGLLAWGAGAALESWGPRPAVLLDPCGPELAAGSEVWVRPAGALGDDGGWIVPGTSRPGSPGAVCPPRAVAPLGAD